MNLLAVSRRKQIPWARRAVGVFVVMWLNLALQPCAMAFGSDQDSHCPNCPPAHSQQHDMASTKAMSGHDMPCVDGSADCEILDDFNYDGRDAQAKNVADDLPGDALPITWMQFVVASARCFPERYAQSHPLGPPQNLNKLYCVYLN